MRGTQPGYRATFRTARAMEKDPGTRVQCLHSKNYSVSLKFRILGLGRDGIDPAAAYTQFTLQLRFGNSVAFS